MVPGPSSVAFATRQAVKCPWAVRRAGGGSAVNISIGSEFFLVGVDEVGFEEDSDAGGG